MRLSVMDIDSSQYALISREMLLNGSYLQVFERGHDYLDKPPLLFWTACLSFKIFGIHDWAFRLPSVLTLALGIYSLYRFTKLFYDEVTAKIAALIMASCCASYLMTYDVRTDTMLTGWVMFSIWQLAEFNNTLKLKNIVLGAIGVGMAMLTKGPLGLIIPLTAFSFHFVYRREWRSFFRWQYLLAIIIIALVLLPMSIGLYRQFDLQPGKTVYDIKNPSGLRFFYWTQSFGRITGESKWNNNPDPFFLVHSFCWSFFPWIVIFIVALFSELRNKIKNFKTPGKTELISLSGFLFVFIFLSMSKYQLPHYTFAIHPFAAVITASFLNRIISLVKSRTLSIIFGIQIFAVLLVYALTLILVNFIFPSPIQYSIFILLSFFAFLYILFINKSFGQNKILVATIIPFITLILILNLNFYPKLLKYQSNSEVAKYLIKIAPENSRLLVFNDYARNSMIFYSKLPIKEYVNESSLLGYLIKGHTFIFADSGNVRVIERIDPQIIPIKQYDDYFVSQLSIRFLNPMTRDSTIGRKVLLKY